MVKILVDTCVWLDLAKDHKQQSLLTVMEQLIEYNELSLLVPRTVIDEFRRNKKRITEESTKSITDVINRVKESFNKFGDPSKKRTVIDQLNNVAYKIPILGESAINSIGRIEKLLMAGEIIETSHEIKIAAAERAIGGQAPFHRQKNSIGDAIIFESYKRVVGDKNSNGIRFAFITHNVKDFSTPNGDHKIPHPDLAPHFSKLKSRYYINLAEAIHKIRPEIVSDLLLEYDWKDEPRPFTEIIKAEGELIDKVWYNRHQYRAYQISKGKVKIIDRKDFSLKKSQKEIVKDIWEGALKSAKRLEKKYGFKNLGPWDDFEWGMVNGKLSALRWVMGEDWDELYT